jgi:hypothetical protein
LAIDPFQADVARIALAAAEHGFALAGGNALVAHGLVQRDTEDVDLFTPEPGGPGAVAYVVRDALAQAGYEVDITRLPEAHQGEFARLEVTRGAETMHVDLARDWRRWPPVQLEVGPVLHLEDAVGSKTTALVTRREPRDFIDIAAALDRYDRAELMRLTFTRDRGLRVVDFADTARRLDQFTTIDFAEYDFDEAALDALRARFADWPRHEDDDHEGLAVRAAVAEERHSQARPTAATLAGQAYPSDATTPPTPDAGTAFPPPPESRSQHRPRS